MKESQAEGFRVEWAADVEKCYRHRTFVRYLCMDDDDGILVDLLDVDGEISSLLSLPLCSLPREGHLFKVFFQVFIHAFLLLARLRTWIWVSREERRVFSDALLIRRPANFTH